MAKSRNWVFTLNANEDKGEHIMWITPGIECPIAKWFDEGKIQYLVCQVEKVGHVHLQGYIQFKGDMRMSALKRINPNAHWEIRRGTHEQARDYAMKLESRYNGPWCLGQEKDNQGKRTDLERIGELVTARKTNLEIIEECGAVASKFAKHIAFLRFVNTEAESDRQIQGVRVLCLYGPTGVGKTYAAINFIAGGKDYYIAEAPSTRGSKLWFDGYEGQHYLILDDFDGDYCTLAYLKRLLDVYKLKIEIKGGFAWAVWTTVVITSNSHPSSWYNKAEMQVNLGPLKRRIQEIRYCESQGAYKRQDWDQKDIDDDFIPYLPNDVVTPTLNTTTC